MTLDDKRNAEAFAVSPSDSPVSSLTGGKTGDASSDFAETISVFWTGRGGTELRTLVVMDFVAGEHALDRFGNAWLSLC